MVSKYEDWFKTEFGGDWDVECSKHFADALVAEAERVRREIFMEAAEIAQSDTSTDTHGSMRIAAKLRALADKG